MQKLSDISIIYVPELTDLYLGQINPSIAHIWQKAYYKFSKDHRIKFKKT